MHAKQMRILIADSDPHRRFTVERFLNQAGCFGVAVSGTVQEMLSLLGYPGKPFDLVLVNLDLPDQQSPAVLEQLQHHRNVVLYRSCFVSGLMADPLAQVAEGLWGLPKAAGNEH
jgi:DNA-binding NarL/FixJ family response regulator